MTYILIAALLIGYVTLLIRVQRIEQALYSQKDSETKKLPRARKELPFDIYATPEKSDQALAGENIPKPTSAVSAKKVTQPLKKSDDHLEVKIGSKLFTGIGAVAIIFGIGFFLRYAFDNNLISETLRVVLGIASGFSLLVLGWFTHKKYSTYGQIVTGSGIALLYLSLFGAFNYYHIMPQTVAFTSMIVVTIIAISLSLYYNSLPLAGFAMFGGFVTPLLLSSGTSSPHTLFTYIALLDIGLLAIATYKYWQYLIIGNLFGTFIIYTSWAAKFYSDDQFFISLLYTTIFFLIFLIILNINQTLKRHIQRGADIILAFLIPVLFFFANYFHFEKLYPDYTIFFVVFLALIYLILGTTFRMLVEDDKEIRYSQTLFAISALFLIVAIPVYFSGNFITIGWSVEALLLLLLGIHLRIRSIRLFAVAAYLLVALRLLIFDISVDASAAAWLNERSAAFVAAFISTSCASIYLWRLRALETFQAFKETEQIELRSSNTLLILMSYAVAFIGVSIEINDFQQAFWFSVSATLFAFAAGNLSFSLKHAPLRFFSYGTFAIAILHVVFVQGRVDVSTYTPLLNDRAIPALILISALIVYSLQLKRQREILDDTERANMALIFFATIQGLALWILSVEVLDFFNRKMVIAQQKASIGIHPDTIISLQNTKRAALSVVWTIYAILSLVGGILKKSNRSRQLSVVLFGIVIFKVFLYDTSNLDDFYRFISFITLGVILLLSGFLYYRYKDRISLFIDAKD